MPVLILLATSFISSLQSYYISHSRFCVPSRSFANLLNKHEIFFYEHELLWLNRFFGESFSETYTKRTVPFVYSVLELSSHLSPPSLRSPIAPSSQLPLTSYFLHNKKRLKSNKTRLLLFKKNPHACHRSMHIFSAINCTACGGSSFVWQVIPSCPSSFM